MFGRPSGGIKMTFSFMTGVVVSPTTSLFHTPSLDTAMLRVQLKIPTANAYVESAHMRVLRPQRSAKRRQMHSPMQEVSQLQRVTLDMVTGLIMAMVTIMAITIVMATMVTMVTTVTTVNMETVKVSIPVASAMIKPVVITMEAMMAQAMDLNMDKVKCRKVLDCRVMAREVGYLRVSNM